MSVIFYSRCSPVVFPIFRAAGDKRAPSATEVARDLWLNGHFVMWHDAMHQRDSVHHRDASETAYLSLGGQTRDKLLSLVRGALYYFFCLYDGSPEVQILAATITNPSPPPDRFHLPAAPRRIYQEETSQTRTRGLKQEAAERPNRKSAHVPDL